MTVSLTSKTKITTNPLTLTMAKSLLLSVCIIAQTISALHLPSSGIITRRAAIAGAASASAIFLPTNLLPAIAADENLYKYENRDRNKNKDALIREDYWYFSGKRPPRRLSIDAFPTDDPSKFTRVRSGILLGSTSYYLLTNNTYLYSQSLECMG